MKFFDFSKYFMLLVVFSLFIAGCGSKSSSGSGDDSSGEEKIVLKVASFFADTSTTYQRFVKPWMERVTERTEGRVEFDYYPSEQLGKAGDLLKLTRDRVTDLSMLPTIYYASEMPILNTLQNMPGITETSYQATMGMWDFIQENEDVLEHEFLKNGVRPLGALNSPPYQIWSKDLEIRTPEDLEGLKIKTAGGMSNKFFEFAGAVPVTVTFPEMYEAVEKGVVDALSIDGKPLISSGVDELLTHGVITNYGTSLQTLIINENVWQSLPDDVKEIMLETGLEVTEEIGIHESEIAKEFFEEFKTEKTIVDLTEEEQQAWKKLAEDFQKKWIDENETDDFKISDYLERYKKSLSKYEEE